MGVNAAPQPQNPQTPPPGSSGGNQPPPPSSQPPPGSNTPPPGANSGADPLAEFFNQGDAGDAGDGMMDQAFKTGQDIQQQTQENLVKNQMRNTAATTGALVHDALNDGQRSEGEGRRANADQAAQRSNQNRSDEGQRSDRYQRHRNTRSRDTRNAREGGLRNLENRRGEGQKADKTSTSDRSAVMNALRRGPGETAEQQSARLQRGTQVSDQDADQAFNRLPPNIRSQLQANGKVQQAKQYLKFQMQMNRLQQLKQQAQQAGDTELAEQLQAAMDELMAQEPEMPPELAAESAEEAEGAEESDESDDVDDAEGGEEGTSTAEESGDTTRRVGSSRDTGEQGGEGTDSGDGQPQAGSQIAASQTPQVTISMSEARDRGTFGSVIASDGNQGDSNLAMDAHLLRGVTRGDGQQIYAVAQGRRVRVCSVGARQGEPSEGNGGTDTTDSLPQSRLERADNIRGEQCFRDENGHIYNPHQLYRAMSESEGNEVRLAHCRVPIEDMDESSAAALMARSPTISRDQAMAAHAEYRQVGLIRARGLVGRGWQGNMESFAQTGYIPAQAC